MKKTFNIKPFLGLLVLALLVGAAGFLLKVTEPDVLLPAEAPFAGEGTEASPYRIATPEDLALFRDMVNAGQRFDNTWFVQTADLDLGAFENWEPVGRWDDRLFCGDYNGAGHVIENLTVAGGDVCGLFAYIDGTVRNLGIESGRIEGTVAAGLVSQAGSRSTVLNCYNKAEIISSDRAAGIAESSSGEILYCWNLGQINCATDKAGGIVGLGSRTVRDCYSVDMPVQPPGTSVNSRDCRVLERTAVDAGLVEAANNRLLDYNQAGLTRFGRLLMDGRRAVQYLKLRDGALRFETDTAEPGAVRRKRLMTLAAFCAVLLPALAAAAGFAVVGCRSLRRRAHKADAGKAAVAGAPGGGRPAIAGLALVLCFTLAFFAATNQVLWYKADGIASLESFYNTGRDAVDVLVLGSSRAGYSIDPEVLWNRAGVAEYTLWAEGQPFWGSYYYLSEALNVCKPRVVALDVTSAHLDDVFVNDDRISLSLFNTYGIEDIFNKIRAIRTFAYQDKWLNLYFGWPMYHTRINELTAIDFQWPGMKDPGRHMAPAARYGRGTLTDYGVAEGTEAYRTMIGKSQAYFDKIISLCRENDIELLLIANPSQYRINTQPWFNYVARLADERSIRFIDYNLLDDITGLSADDYWIDDIHLNTVGGRKISEHLCDYLTEHYDLPDHRGDPRYSAWDSYSTYHENDYIRKITDADDFLRELARDDRTAVFIRYGRDEDDAFDDLLERAASDGMNLGFLRDAKNGCWLMLSTRASEAVDWRDLTEGVATFAAGARQMTVDVSGARGIELDGMTVASPYPGVMCVVMDTGTGDYIRAFQLIA